MSTCRGLLFCSVTGQRLHQQAFTRVNPSGVLWHKYEHSHDLGIESFDTQGLHDLRGAGEYDISA
jgi:hypothetical protein